MTQPHEQSCPISASLNQLGDMWTLMIVREAMAGARRFKDFRAGTGIAKNLLSSRLKQMTEYGILEQYDAGQHGPRHEYRLTAKGRALAPIMTAISQWGNQWIYGEGNEPVRLVNRKTGKPIAHLRPSSDDGDALDWRDVAMITGPGASGMMRERLEKLEQSMDIPKPPPQPKEK